MSTSNNIISHSYLIWSWGVKEGEGGAAPTLSKYTGSNIDVGLFICFEIPTAAWTGLGNQSPDFTPFWVFFVPDLDHKYLVSVDQFETSQLSQVNYLKASCLPQKHLVVLVLLFSLLYQFSSHSFTHTLSLTYRV